MKFSIFLSVLAFLALNMVSSAPHVPASHSMAKRDVSEEGDKELKASAGDSDVAQQEASPEAAGDAELKSAEGDETLQAKAPSKKGKGKKKGHHEGEHHGEEHHAETTPAGEETTPGSEEAAETTTHKPKKKGKGGPGGAKGGKGKGKKGKGGAPHPHEGEEGGRDHKLRADEDDASLKASADPDATLKAAADPDATLKAAANPDATLKAAADPDASLKAAADPDAALKAEADPDASLRASASEGEKPDVSLQAARKETSKVGKKVVGSLGSRMEKLAKLEDQEPLKLEVALNCESKIMTKTMKAECLKARAKAEKNQDKVHKAMQKSKDGKTVKPGKTMQCMLTPNAPECAKPAEEAPKEEAKEE